MHSLTPFRNLSKEALMIAQKLSQNSNSGAVQSDMLLLKVYQSLQEKLGRTNIQETEGRKWNDTDNQKRCEFRA